MLDKDKVAREVAHASKVMALGFNAARGVKCSVEGCQATPSKLWFDEQPLCDKHYAEEEEGMERWDLEKLLKKYEPALYEQYRSKHGL